MERKLGEAQYMRDVLTYLQSQVFVPQVDKRLKMARGIIFSPQFLRTIRLTDRHNNTPLKRYNNITLFARIGTTHQLTVTQGYVKNFFIRTLRYVK